MHDLLGASNHLHSAWLSSIASGLSRRSTKVRFTLIANGSYPSNRGAQHRQQVADVAVDDPEQARDCWFVVML